ncbi:MAG TPA: sugar nucleotide-binding protein [Terriglobia bacterium]|nr:sugar nucleotide-binding protein [Terriglobia bacterium]
MILLLGATGYVGKAFSSELRRRKLSFIPLTRKAIDYTSFETLFDYVRKMKPEFIINAAGRAPGTDGAGSHSNRWDMLCANGLLPQTIARVSLMTNTPWGHVSSGSIYTGAKLAVEGGRTRIERDLSRPDVQRLFAAYPEKIHGFTELDEPNFSFRHSPCGFYSGTKALAEEAIHGVGRSYIWRPRLLFDDCDHSRNLLSRILCANKIDDNINSISHLDDFVTACLELWDRQAAFGIYNVVNTGAVTTRRIVELIRQFLNPPVEFEFVEDAVDSCDGLAQSPRSNCVLDASKLMAAGVRMRSADEALQRSLQMWHAPVSSLEHHGTWSEPMNAPRGAAVFGELFAPQT